MSHSLARRSPYLPSVAVIAAEAGTLAWEGFTAAEEATSLPVEHATAAATAVVVITAAIVAVVIMAAIVVDTAVGVVATAGVEGIGAILVTVTDGGGDSELVSAGGAIGQPTRIRIGIAHRGLPTTIPTMRLTAVQTLTMGPMARLQQTLDRKHTTTPRRNLRQRPRRKSILTRTL